MRIAFVGASGYGNVGDDTYPLVFRQFLPEHELIFFNSDLPKAMPPDIRLLVLGGGGILYNSRMEPETAGSRHFCCMLHYMKWAQAAGVPWGILSCGFQFAVGQDCDNPVALEPWKPWLKQARFITLRSPKCLEIATKITGRGDCQFFPDAAYLFRPETVPSANTDYQLTIVPAGAINARDRFVQHFVKLYGAPGINHTWLNMGAIVDAAPLLADAARKYPDATLVEQPTPAEAFAQIARSRFVISGRYHGMVFARICNVPFFVSQNAPHKIAHEDFSVDPALAMGHIETLREQIANL